jgi:transcriptional regulator with XRE-family HTH domain
MDDRRVGRIIREVRRRRGWRQVDLARRARVSQSQASEAERGRVEHVSLAALRRIGHELDIRISIDAWWTAGRIDQLLDRKHAAIVEATVLEHQALGYEVRVEYGFNEFGDRGSVDVLGWRSTDRTLAIDECKSRIDDVQDTAASFSRKARLIPDVVRRDEGWQAARVIHVLVIADTHQNRDVIRRHQATFDTLWPLRTTAIRAALAGTGEVDAGGVRFLPMKASDHR